MTFRFVAIFFPVFLFLASSSSAQEYTTDSNSETTRALRSEDSLRQEQSLLSVIQSLDNTRVQLSQTQAQLEGQAGAGREEFLKREIQDLSAKEAELEHHFREIASGIDLVPFTKKVAREPINWTNELEILLSPLLNEIKRITSRPREMDRLRSEVADGLERKKLIEAAEKNISLLTKQTENTALREALSKLADDWKAKREEAITRIRIATQQIERREAERKSLSESLEKIFQIFFRSRGRNLILACLATLIFWILIRRLHRYVETKPRFARKQNRFGTRLIHISLFAVTIVGAVLTFQLVLFLFSDWVLLILSILLLLGIFWASKQAIPRFWTQGTLLLNMGGVREGERVIYRGLPWKISNLNLYTQLENPALDGGVLRIPLDDISELRSRAYGEDELWFPTKKGDWIILDDGTYGEIVHQSIEFVTVRLKGRSAKRYATSAFLDQNPQNLSTGFRISSRFGIDYQHQTSCTDAIPEKLQSYLVEQLSNHGFGEYLESLKVEFAEAGASSLNLAILANFNGEVALRYRVLTRLIQRICVDACNKYRWSIPFEQLTVHMAR